MKSKEEILKEVIKGYRKVLFERYQYENIKQNFKIPKSITKPIVDDWRTYYLTYVYPEYSKRIALNEAFKSLDSFTKHPQKLVTILLDATKLIFKYGFHIPKILNAGLKALKTFKTANHFEETFVNEAIDKNINPPFSADKIDMLLKALSRKKIDDFIESSEALYEVLYDKKLIKKIKDIIQYLIKTMKSKKNAYSYNQIKGLEIAFELLNEGDKLFNKLSNKNKKKLLLLVINIEKEILDTI